MGDPICAAALREIAGLLESLADRRASTWGESLAPIAADLKIRLQPTVSACVRDLWSKLTAFTRRNVASAGSGESTA